MSCPTETTAFYLPTDLPTDRPTLRVSCSELYLYLSVPFPFFDFIAKGFNRLSDRLIDRVFRPVPFRYSTPLQFLFYSRVLDTTDRPTDLLATHTPSRAMYDTQHPVPTVLPLHCSLASIYTSTSKQEIKWAFLFLGVHDE